MKRTGVAVRVGAGLMALLGLMAVAAGGASAQAPDEDLRAAMLQAQTQGLADTLAARQALIARPVLSGPVDPESYRLGPGDVFSLEYGGKATGSRSFSVDGEGRVRVPELGVITAGGRALAEFRTEVLRRLKTYLPGAALDLRLVQPRTFKLYVLGEVKSPGVVEVVGSARVAEAIEAAGGTTKEASARNVRIVRRGGETERADLLAFQRTGAWEANPYLQDGDRVVVPMAVEKMGVFGAVAVSDVYEFRLGDRLTTAIDVAGGLRPEARLDSVQIVRFRGAADLDTLYADLGAVREGRTEDVPLQADDRVFVRLKAEWHRAQGVTIDGEVRSPGGYAIEEGKHRLSDVIAWAGGFTSEAARSNVRVERRLEPTTRDVEYERLSRMSRSEMTNSEYQTFRGKLALRQASYLVDFSAGAPRPPQSDVLLKDGDRIEVGRLELAVRVDGMVKRPGLIAYQEGLSVRDYVRLAGGTTARAAGGDMRLTRAGSSATQFARDVKKVEPGDFIWVPEKKDVSFWTVFRDVIIVAGQVATIVLVIDQLSQP